MVTERISTAAARCLAVATLIGLPGCGVTDTRGCTEIGCSPGVRIEFSGVVPADFTIEVRSEGATPFIRECSSVTPCGSSVFAYGTHGNSIEVVVTTGDETLTRTLVPTYEEFRPNGPGCEPACVQGSAAFAFSS